MKSPLTATIEAFIHALGTPTALTPPVRHKVAYWNIDSRSAKVYTLDGKVLVLIDDYVGKCSGHVLTIVPADANPTVTSLDAALRRYGTCTLELAIEAAQECLVNGLPE